MKSCSNCPSHMTKMAAMPIYGKNLKKSSSLEPIDRWPWNLVCSIVYASTTKDYQGCSNYDPGLTLDPFYAKVKFGHILFLLLQNLFFGKYHSFRSQSWFKHSSEWVNEVKWISKVKVIDLEISVMFMSKFFFEVFLLLYFWQFQLIFDPFILFDFLACPQFQRTSPLKRQGQL